MTTTKQIALTVHTDGGSRGNPGPAAIGVVIEQENKTLFSIGKCIGNTTNNVAEYTAVIQAWEWILNHENNPMKVNFFLDSELVVNQLNGKYRVKDLKMKSLLTKVNELSMSSSSEATYTAVRREYNKTADRLVNEALDNLL